jgi:hypothetical protein
MCFFRAYYNTIQCPCAGDEARPELIHQVASPAQSTMNLEYIASYLATLILVDLLEPPA